MKQLKLILIGGGDRGSCYMRYLNLYPEKFKLVAIAEPVKEKRDYFRDTYGVAEEMCFSNYEDLLSKPKLADIAMICTQDKMHYAPAMKAIEKKYDLLLEKPIATTPEECLKISNAAHENGVRVLVCCVLRYTPFYKAVKKFVESGKLGDIKGITHSEGVGNVHMSHSYVRGNWRNTKESTPMILAKCVHDTDLLQWFCEDECISVQSYGSLSHFTKENAPEGAPERCLDGCPHKDTCFYYAPSLYKIDSEEVKHFRAVVANKFGPTDEEVDAALVTSPYGRCVYHCDNDVVDHQTVSLKFKNDKYATLTMSGFTKGGRLTTFMGTKGELRLNLENQFMEFYDFATRQVYEIYDSQLDEEDLVGHGGGDMGIMHDLYEYIANDNPSSSISDISISTLGHLACFAAEESRISGKVVDLGEYAKSLDLSKL